MAEKAAIDPISAIAGAAGSLFDAAGSIFGGRQQRLQAEAEADAQKVTALSQQEMARIGYLNTGMVSLFDVRRAELEIERQRTANEGNQTNPITALVITGGVLFMSLLVYFILIELKN